MSNSWSICLESWILTDGNYADFKREQERQFALEFYLNDFEKSDLTIKSAELIDRAKYRVNALVSYIDSEMWVLDFGVKAYKERSRQCLPVSGFPEEWIKAEAFVWSLKVGEYVRAQVCA